MNRAWAFGGIPITSVGGLVTHQNSVTQRG